MHQTENTRVLPIEGAYNVRDLGGYRTKDNRSIKWRKLLRAGDLAQLTEEDINYFKQISLKTIIDFRSKAEKEAAPDRKPNCLSKEIWLPIEAGNLGNVMPESEESIPQLMIEVYKSIIHHPQEVNEFFRIVEDSSSSPLLFHCSAGKDRTGIASALLLAALGVDRDTIMEDYMLSAIYIKGKYDFVLEKFPSFAPLLTVRAEYLEATLKEIDEKFGSIEAYLVEQLDVNIGKLKENYLE